MFGFYVLTARKVRYRAGELEDAVIRAGGEVELVDRRAEQVLHIVLRAAELANLFGVHVRVAVCAAVVGEAGPGLDRRRGKFIPTGNSRAVCAGGRHSAESQPEPSGPAWDDGMLFRAEVAIIPESNSR